MRKRVIAAAFAMTVGFALAGCSVGGTGQAGQPEGSNGDGLVTCDVLGAAEVGDVIGETLVSETMDTPSGTLDPVGCSYSGTSGPPEILVTVYRGAKYHAGIDGVGRVDPVAIDGLGEDAYLDDGAVRFLSGEWACAVSRIAGEVSDGELETIARLLASKLP